MRTTLNSPGYAQTPRHSGTLIRIPRLVRESISLDGDSSALVNPPVDGSMTQKFSTLGRLLKTARTAFPDVRIQTSPPLTAEGTAVTGEDYVIVARNRNQSTQQTRSASEARKFIKQRLELAEIPYEIETVETLRNRRVVEEMHNLLYPNGDKGKD